MTTLADEEDFDSDSSDEDYVPCEGEVLSEEEHSGEDEDFIPGDDDTVKNTTGTGKKKKGKGKKKQKEEDFSRKRTGGIRLEDDGAAENSQGKEPEADTYNKELAEQIVTEKVVKKEEEEKKKADSLWADFMSDVGSPKTKPKASSGGLGSLSKPTSSPSITKSKISSASASPAAAAAASCTPASSTSSSSVANPSKITITTEYDFAGEVVKISKEVDADSKEAKAEKKKQEKLEEQSKPTAGPNLAGLKRPGGGLGSVLGKIGKKPKMGTLEKSKLDWDSFKQEEGIDEELQIYNRGKAGYLERKEFLERTDLRQFERERDVRLKMMDSKR